MNESPDPDGLPRAFLAYLMLTALVSGALIMVIEVLGSRVIGPFFGVSLFVWTSLITVTLIALASGYAIGGLVADRNSSPDYLYGAILVAGVLALLIPLVKSGVLKASAPLGLRGGTFVSTLVLFGPVLFMLGCVSPYLVKIATRQIERIGRTVGGLYALSTLGSVLGTALTGFFLIGYLGVTRIFQVIGAVLIVLAVGYFVFFRGRLVPVLALGLPFLVTPPPSITTKLMDSGTRATVTATVDSFYGHLKVVDYTYKARHTRELMIDGLIQGGIDVASGLPIYAYAYFLQFIPVALNPDGKRCLVLGLGPGIVPRWYEARGIRTDVVDIDPAVVRLANQYFDFTHLQHTVIADARRYLAGSDSRYDYIILDVFSGDTTPAHLLSLEALALVKRRLTQDGVLAVNFVGSLRTKTYMTASLFRTLGELFTQVDIYPAFDVNQGDGSGNLVLVAYDGPARRVDRGSISRKPIHRLARAVVIDNIGRPFRFPANVRALILTDEFNPVDFYDAWLKESVRSQILEGTDWDTLIDS